jgi:hypothetical protein
VRQICSAVRNQRRRVILDSARKSRDP